SQFSASTRAMAAPSCLAAPVAWLLPSIHIRVIKNRGEVCHECTGDLRHRYRDDAGAAVGRAHTPGAHAAIFSRPTPAVRLEDRFRIQTRKGKWPRGI